MSSRIGRPPGYRQPWLLALIVSACVSPSSSGLPDGEPLVRGPIESIDHRATASGILVRAAPGSREMCGIAATADEETRYLRQEADGRRVSLDRSELEVGDTVEVYVTGPIAESCPVQGRASAIVPVSRG
ncbi:MAG TPA: hypothetical protein VF167_08920 [Longimicrobiaceae bacterium]